MSDTLITVIGIVGAFFAATLGQVIAGWWSTQAAREERQAARLAAREERESARWDRADLENRQRFAALSALAAELRLNLILARSEAHQPIAGAWVPFKLETYVAVQPYLATLPPELSRLVSDAVSIPMEYLAIEQIQRPTEFQPWNDYRKDRPYWAIEPLEDASDALDAYLREQTPCKESA